MILKFFLFLFLLPILTNFPIFNMLIYRFYKIFHCFITFEIEWKIVDFYVDYEHILLDDLIRLQDVWFVLFCMLNVLLLLFMSNIKFQLYNWSKNSLIQSIKENKVYSLFFFIILFFTILSICYSINERRFPNFVFVLDEDLQKNLNLFSKSRQFVSRFYFLIIFFVCFFSQNKWTITRTFSWYFLWVLVRNLECCSCGISDVTTLLFFRGIEVEILISTFSFLPSSFFTTFCMDEKSSLATFDSKKCDPCQSHLDKLIKCSTAQDDFLSSCKKVLGNNIPGLKTLSDIDRKYAIGDCVVHHKTNYDDCLAELAKKKK